MYQITRYFLILLLVSIGCKKKDNPVIISSKISISAILPSEGRGGDTVTIKGSHFSPIAVGNLVLFHTDTARVSFASVDSLIVIAPLHATTGSISVTVNGETAIGPVFTFLADSIPSDTTHPAEDTVDLYAAGYDADVVYWKNGTENLFTHLITASYSSAYGMVLVDTDVYIVGTHNQVAKYWKNGVETILSNPDYQGGEARAIVATGNNIYIGGSDRFLPVYWKNDMETNLSSSNGIVNGMAVLNENVYAVGKEASIAVFWKNGIRTQLGDTTSTDIGATSIAFLGSDVLVCGAESGNAVLWKNGIKMILAPTSNGFPSVAYAITVVGNNVIIVGNDGADAVYWLNGTEVKLPKGGFNAAATAVTFYGNDVYIAGYDEATGAAPVYWKNGVKYHLPSGNVSRAYTIAVTKRR